jgi:Carboxypeptidase regulatory-like domain
MPIGVFLVIAATSLVQNCTTSGSVIEAGNGKPVSQAQVAVDGGQEIGAATDADGEFSIAAESCGKVRLVVGKTGFEPQRLSQDNGQKILIRLQRVSGVSGVVLDANGQPIPDAVVEAGFPDAPVAVRPGMATAGQSGEYALTLQPFLYMICAHSNANVYPVGGGHKLRYADRCINTTINPGQQQRLDFTLSALAPVHLSGSVSGAPEGAVPMVALYNKGREGGTALAVKSTLGGLYDFPDVLPDVYTVQATAVYGEKAFFVSEDAAVGAGGLANLGLTLLPSIDLTGSVRFKSPSGRRGRVRLDLFPASGSVEWNEAGDSFTISNVLQRKYRLGIIALQADGSGGMDDFYVQSVQMRGEDLQGQEFSVVGGAAPIDIVLADDFGTLTGTVTDSDGKPVSSGVRVSGKGYSVAFTIGDEGKIGPMKIPPGEYVVYATDAIMIRRDAPEGASKVAVPPSGSVSVSLKRIDPQ